MKRQAHRLLALSFAILLVAYAVSCAQEGARPTEQATKNGQSEMLNQASIASTVSTQNKAQQENVSLTANEAPGLPSVLDVPAAQPALDGNLGIPNPAFGASQDPLLSQLPYYCDPLRYAPNIINNNRACLPFQPIPYLGFGADRGPGLGLFPPGPVGYRLRDGDDVGRISHDDDDNNRHHHKGKWQSHGRH